MIPMVMITTIYNIMVAITLSTVAMIMLTIINDYHDY